MLGEQEIALRNLIFGNLVRSTFKDANEILDRNSELLRQIEHQY